MLYPGWIGREKRFSEDVNFDSRWAFEKGCFLLGRDCMRNVMKGLKEISFAEWTLYGALLFVGIFHVYLSCALSVILLLRLFLISRKKGKLLVRWDLTFLFTLILVSWYALSSLWAIDSGTAIFGFFKFLPLPLFLLLLMQNHIRNMAEEKALQILEEIASVLL